ncbi:Rossmann-fold NAD(P)-binding domain-containing protein [Agromyces silvae]|uniref:hypothetical protein n=1 Tax=Agromyces silvae TaxID=3388266 RepID=UPI00280BD4EA|nr:hypothetical protein [Agromyces protaetiae]
MRARRVIVVGASGILAPAAIALRDRGDAVTAVARTRPLPAGVAGLHVDATSADELGAALGEERWDVALVYAPAVTDASVARLRDAVDGRLVLVQTTAAVDPARVGDGEPAVPGDVLQLGWHDEASGSARWHGPTEISVAALEVLADGEGRVLGSIRPWGRRP